MTKKLKKCIGADCDRPAKIEQFCGFCHKKFNKGLLKANGELSFEAESAKKAKEIKQNKKLQALKKKIIEEKKLYIKEHLTSEKLKNIQNLPMYKATFTCPALQIQVCQANCLHRMFLAEYPKKECRKCVYHNDRYDTWISDLKTTSDI